MFPGSCIIKSSNSDWRMLRPDERTATRIEKNFARMTFRSSPFPLRLSTHSQLHRVRKVGLPSRSGMRYA